MRIKKLPDDPRFKHVRYCHTDLRKTFARARAAQRAVVVKVPALEVDTVVKVVNFTKGAKRK